VHYVSDSVTVTYRYDALGNRTTMTDTLGVTRYEYDDLYRLISVTNPFTGTVKYGYDLAGNRTQLIYPGGKVVTYAYNANNRLVQVQDWDGGVTNYKYDEGERMITTTLPNGVVSVQQYNDANRLVRLTHTAADTVLSDYQYQLDSVGNRVQVTETLTGTTQVVTNTYDLLGRLTESVYSTGESFTYVYDAVSNITMTIETITSTTVTTYAYNAAYQLVAARASDDVGTWYYIYDGCGNLLRQTPGGTAPTEGETRYTYNAAGLLVRVELYTAGDYITLAEAFYDGDSERVRLTTWAEGVPVTTTYDIFDGQLLASDNGTQTTLYLYGRTLIAEYQDEWVYLLRDRDDSLRQMVDEDAAIILMQTYKPLGGILQEQGSYETVFGFLGAQLDRVSGLLYADGRYYDPVTRRFLTPNRRFAPYHPRSSNPYVTWANFSLLLLAPLMILSGAMRKGRKRCKYTQNWLLVLVVVWAIGALAACDSEPPPTLPPLPDTSILDAPWADEMTQEMRREYPNSCGLLALYMFLQAEDQFVDLSTLAQQLRAERPGGYDGYCCTWGQGPSWEGVPTPTPDPLGWCNEACVSAETLADVARKHYGMAIESGDNWTRERVHAKLMGGHPVLALVRVDLSTNQFGHFVVIRGLIDQGATVVFNDSYPRDDRRTWNMSLEERRAMGEGRMADWHDFDRSWASNVDEMDPLGGFEFSGHVRWAMAAQ
jgi:RHS repeat-associated protein